MRIEPEEMLEENWISAHGRVEKSEAEKAFHAGERQSLMPPNPEQYLPGGLKPEATPGGQSETPGAQPGSPSETAPAAPPPDQRSEQEKPTELAARTPTGARD
jgi:hypothetical protein